MKKIVYLLALLLSIGLSLNAQVRTAKDGIPLTIMDLDSAIVTANGSIIVNVDFPAVYSVHVVTVKESGTADGYLIWMGSNDGSDYIHTDSLLLNNDKNQFLVTGTTAPYKYYRMKYREATAAGQDILVTFLARRKY